MNELNGERQIAETRSSSNGRFSGYPIGTSMAPNEAPRLGLDVDRIYHLLLSRIWLLVGCVALLLGLAAVYLAKAPRIYAARTVIQVEQRDRRVLKIDEVSPTDLMSLETMKTYEQALASRTLLLQVARKNGLEKVKGYGLDMGGVAVGDEGLAKTMTKVVDVKLRRGTRLIDVTVEDVDRERAKRVADSLVTEFLREGFDQKVAVTKEANVFLTTEADRFKLKLQKSEQDLQAYKEKYQAVSLEERQNITVERLKEISSQYTAAKAERLRLEADIAALNDLNSGSTEDLLKIPSIAALPEIALLQKSLQDREAELGVLEKRYMAKHPTHIAAASGIRETKAALQGALTTAGEKLQRSYRGARETETRFEQELKQQEQFALELNKLSIPYNVLQREVESDSAMYQAVLARLKETSVSQNIDNTPVRVIETAILPEKPIKPNRLKVLALALIGGVALGLGLIFGLDQLNNSFRGVEDLESTLGLPVIAVIQKLKGVLEGPILPLEGREALGLEGFRALRASVSLLADFKDARTLLFTSSSPGEGKSFCSANFAAVLARDGQRTVLVDADLRRPVVANRFGIRGAGLTDVLRGNVAVEEALRLSPYPQLSILTAGSYSDSPSELLGNGQFPLVLERLLNIFDRVVIDSAPVNAVADTLLIAGRCDAVCFVVEAGKGHRRGVTRAGKLLMRAQARLSGVILNQVSRGEESYDYGYGRSYGTNHTVPKAGVPVSGE